MRFSSSTTCWDRTRIAADSLAAGKRFSSSTTCWDRTRIAADSLAAGKC
ncbi:hypothetical protein OROMI_008295 [Orobanche minor]